MYKKCVQVVQGMGSKVFTLTHNSYSGAQSKVLNSVKTLSFPLILNTFSSALFTRFSNKLHLLNTGLYTLSTSLTIKKKNEI